MQLLNYSIENSLSVITAKNFKANAQLLATVQTEFFVQTSTSEGYIRNI